MLYVVVLITLSSVAIGWLSITITTSLALRRLSTPRREMIERIAKHAAAGFSFNEVAAKITDSSNLLLLTPELEKHMDTFLRVKLKESMPVVGMFIGDRTINQLKELFMQELELLFPSVMKTYLTGLEKQFDVEALIIEKLAAIPPGNIKTLVKENLQKELRAAQWLGAAIGLVIGLFQSFFIFLMVP